MEKLVSQIKNDGKNKQYDCIVGVSGGIDSAIVLALVKKASKQFNTNINNIVAVYSPVNNKGMTNIDLSYKNALSISNHLNIKLND